MVGALTMKELPEVIQKLWCGKNLFSQSVCADLWLVFCNRHIFFSCFLAHRLHPFSKCERFLVLACTMLFGFGVSGMVVLIIEEGEDFAEQAAGNATIGSEDVVEEYDDFKRSALGWLIPLIVTVIVQAAYDTFAKTIFQCKCSENIDEHARPKLKSCCMRLQRCGGFLAVGGAGLVATPAIYAVATSEGWDLVLRTWGISRGVSFIGTANAVLLATFWLGRRRDRRKGWGKPGDRFGWTAIDQLPSSPSVGGFGLAGKVAPTLDAGTPNPAAAPSDDR